MRKQRYYPELPALVLYDIGEHEHVEETECYVIKSGKGVVIDNGKKIDISAGDVVITGNGDVHSVINTENEDLEILAFIVLN